MMPCCPASLTLLPELVAFGNRNPDIEAALESYENDLPSPHVTDVELLHWKRKWCSTEDADLPTSAVQTIAACNREYFPNIHTLIRILCTLPITSAECERSFSDKHVRSTATKASSVCVARKRQNLVRTKCRNVRILDQSFSLEPIWNPPS